MRPSFQQSFAFSAALLAVLLAAGCATPTPRSPEPEADSLARARQTSEDGAPAPDLAHWWQSFGDPLLDQLAPALLRENLGLAQARSRLRQARLQAGRDDTQYRPTVHLGGRPQQDAAAIDTYYRSAIEASWELSLFGESRSLQEVATARVLKARADGHAAQVATLAELVRQVLALRAAQRDAQIWERLEALDAQALRVQQLRKSLHLGSLAEEQAAAERLADSQARRAGPRQAAAAALQAMALLLGRDTPDPAWKAEPAPRVPAVLPPLGTLPVGLLRARADVRAAEAEIQQAAGALGLARAELYPRIALGASKVWSFNLTQNRRVLSGNVTGIGPVLDFPLFDWDRRRLHAEAQSAALDTAVLAWREALTTAISEAQTAMTALDLAVEQASRQQALLERSRQQADQQATRVQLGLLPASERLNAEREVLLAAQALAAAHLARDQALVTLYRALGGAPPFEAPAEGKGP